MFEIKALVPAMTSNTTPEGSVIYVGRPLNYPDLYKVFDGNLTDVGFVDNGSSPIQGHGTLNEIAGYSFTKEVICKSAHFEWAYNWSGGTNAWVEIRIVGSNDGSNWEALSEYYKVDQSNDNRIIDIQSTSDKAFSMLGIEYGEYNLPSTGMPVANEIQFYGFEKYTDYGYLGLFWFEEGEDVKIFDVETGTELTEHTLDKRSDEIEIIIEEVQNE